MILQCQAEIGRIDVFQLIIQSGQVQLCLVFTNKGLVFVVLSLTRDGHEFCFRLVVRWTCNK